MLRSHTEKWGNFESLINCKLPVFHCLCNGAHYVPQFIALRRHWTLIVCHFQRFRGKRPLILDWYRSVVCHPSECRQVYTLHESAKTDMETNLQWKRVNTQTQQYESNSFKCKLDSFLQQCCKRFPHFMSHAMHIHQKHKRWYLLCRDALSNRSAIGNYACIYI